MAEALECSPGTVKARLPRSLSRLRKDLKRDGRAAPPRHARFQQDRGSDVVRCRSTVARSSIRSCRGGAPGRPCGDGSRGRRGVGGNRPVVAWLGRAKNARTAGRFDASDCASICSRASGVLTSQFRDAASWVRVPDRRPTCPGPRRPVTFEGDVSHSSQHRQMCAVRSQLGTNRE